MSDIRTLSDAELLLNRRVGPRFDDLATAFLVSYHNPKTRESHSTSLRQWHTFTTAYGFDPVRPERPHIELWLHQLEQLGKGPRTRQQRLTTLHLFYAYLIDEGVIDKDPTARVKRPKVPRYTTTGYLRNSQLLDLVNASVVLGPHAHALICVLVFNGLRIGEACGTDVGSFFYRDSYPYLRVRRKGGNYQDIELSRRTEHAVEAIVMGRYDGPLFLTSAGTRMNRAAAARLLERCRPAIRNCPERLHPHLLRHSWSSEGLRQGIALDQMIHDGGWKDGRMLHEVYAHGHDMPGRAAAHRIESAVLSG